MGVCCFTTSIRTLEPRPDPIGQVTYANQVSEGRGPGREREREGHENSEAGRQPPHGCDCPRELGCLYKDHLFLRGDRGVFDQPPLVGPGSNIVNSQLLGVAVRPISTMCTGLDALLSVHFLMVVLTWILQSWSQICLANSSDSDHPPIQIDLSILKRPVRTRAPIKVELINLTLRVRVRESTVLARVEI